LKTCGTDNEQGCPTDSTGKMPAATSERGAATW
jgi:hypothetical protein